VTSRRSSTSNSTPVDNQLRSLERPREPPNPVPVEPGPAHTYDHNGNQTAAGSNSYSYDLANRLISATVGSTTTNYSYDGDRNRLSANDGNNTTNFIWDPAASIPQLDIEQDGSHNDLRTYLYGHRLVSMATSGGTPATYYYHYDGLGSVTNLTDASGNPQWTYSYDPWGNTTPTQNATGAPANAVQFAGAYVDPTGLDHLGAREYDPATGRFTAADPANLAYGSTYAYVDDQPTVATDPSGLGKQYESYVGSTTGDPCSWGLLRPVLCVKAQATPPDDDGQPIRVCRRIGVPKRIGDKVYQLWRCAVTYPNGETREEEYLEEVDGLSGPPSPGNAGQSHVPTVPQHRRPPAA
jgi:RHS repeat-associated protein